MVAFPTGGFTLKGRAAGLADKLAAAAAGGGDLVRQMFVVIRDGWYFFRKSVGYLNIGGCYKDQGKRIGEQPADAQGQTAGKSKTDN